MTFYQNVSSFIEDNYDEDILAHFIREKSKLQALFFHIYFGSPRLTECYERHYR